MPQHYPVVIIGAGIAGATVALKLSELRPDLQLVVLSKSALAHCSSFMAQGGIASEYKTSEEDIELHIQDTLKAGNYLNNEAVVRWWAHRTEHGIDHLLKWGVSFNVEKALEGGHTTRRIFKVEDQTGRSIMEVLWLEMAKRKNISIIEHANVISIKNVDGNNSYSVAYLKGTSECIHITTAHLVFASGGLGCLIAPSTANPIAAAEVMGMGIDLGIETNFLSCVQFHPTGLHLKNESQTLLISEAVRGEGARLINSKGEYFMANYDDRKDLAPRDIVSRAIFEEMKNTTSACVFLDARNITQKEWIKKFPFIYSKLKEQNIHPDAMLIPVYPVSHYMCGGMVTDTQGLTSVKGLYAVGEISSTGIHGNNRLASNSLSEAVVFGLSLANYLAAVSYAENENENLKSVDFRPVQRHTEGITDELSAIAEDLYSVYKFKKSAEEVNLLMANYRDSLLSINKNSVLYYSMLVVLSLLNDYCNRVEGHVNVTIEA